MKVITTQSFTTFVFMKKEKASRPDYQLKNCLLWLFVWPYADNFCFFVFKQASAARSTCPIYFIFTNEAQRRSSKRHIRSRDWKDEKRRASRKESLIEIRCWWIWKAFKKLVKTLLAKGRKSNPIPFTPRHEQTFWFKWSTQALISESIQTLSWKVLCNQRSYI